MGRFIDMTGWIMSEHGVPDSRITIIERIENYISPSGSVDTQWVCECACKNHTRFTAIGCNLRRGTTKSCGCLQKELAAQRAQKRNNFDISGEFGIGWAINSGIQFEFDLFDYDIIKNHCWSTCTDHYGYTRVETQIKIDGKYKRISLSQFLTGTSDIDHADKNPLNNRRNNFRVATRSQQTFNQGLKANNTSGITGVYWDKTHGVWIASLQKDKKRIFQERHTDFNQAVFARLNAELKYFGEFAPQKHLFNQYGIATKQGEVCDELQQLA